MVMIKAINVNTCQYSNNPIKSMHVIITPKAAYTELTNKFFVMVTYFENEVKQLDHSVMNKVFTSMVKNEIKTSMTKEKRESLR
jgi:hypothetical protein